MTLPTTYSYLITDSLVVNFLMAVRRGSRSLIDCYAKQLEEDFDARALIQEEFLAVIDTAIRFADDAGMLDVVRYLERLGATAHQSSAFAILKEDVA